MRRVADGLNARGYAIRPTDYERGCAVTIDWRGAQCTLSVSDWGNVEWECRQWPGGEADPGQIANVATTFLTGTTGGYPRRGAGYGRRGMSFKGIVGQELKARGLDVILEVYRDEDYFDAQTEIMVTNPHTRDGATVYVSDAGDLTWERDYWADAATSTEDPEPYQRIAESGKIASAIAETVALAMSCISPAGKASPA